MKQFLKFGVAAAVVMALISVTETSQRSVQARPTYAKAFVATYPGLEAAAKEAKCNVCHEGTSKKMRNAYGKALAKSLGEPNVKDEAAIVAGLKKTEGEKSAVEGKTFGDLIKDGKLPASE